MSLIALAANCVRNSEHCGGAVRVTRSYKDLQSVAATLGGRFWALYVAVVYDSGRFRKVSPGFFHCVEGSIIQAQHKRIQESWSSVDPRETVSAARVLVTTLCIFLHPQLNGLTKHISLSQMLLWVAMMIIPVCELGFPFEANDASENAKNRKSSLGIAWMVIWTSWCFFASCNVWLPWRRVSTVALLISDCKKLNLLGKSGLVCTAAYWRLPINALRDCFSSSLTGLSPCFLRSGLILMGSMART